MSAPRARFRFRPRVVELARDLEPWRALRALAGHRLPILLDSAAGEPCRASVLAFDPLPARAEGVRPGRFVAPLRALHAQLAAEPGDPVPGPFHGGLLAALGYDLGAEGERPVAAAPEPWGEPAFVGGLYVDFLVRDEAARRTWLVLGEDPGDGRPALAARRELVERELASSERELASPERELGSSARELASPERELGSSERELGSSARELASSAQELASASRGRPAPHPERAASGEDLAASKREPAPRAEPAVRHTPPAEHARRIESLRASIARGDLYQANLAHRFSARVRGEPHAWYARLRASNPAPYMAFARWRESDGFAPAGALLSSSPELFFELAGGVARTRPIKGTSERAADPAEDARRAAALLSSAKDRAELAMIVDLERNDLGRCALPGGVTVEGWPTLRSYARVHHLMADVVARLRPGVDAFEVLGALFPGGSISGAPKLAALAHVAALEQEGRGFFCGSLGFVDTRGDAAFNILIRTLAWRGSAESGELAFRVGGGITWSSDARAEERETLAKAAGLLAALAGPVA